MKVAYLTTFDSSDIHAWSGSGSYILRALQDAGLQTQSIGNLKDGRFFSHLSRLKENFYTRMQSKTYLKDREPGMLKYYSTQAKKLLESVDHDIVFSPGTIPIAHLQTDKPIVFWTDATFAGMINFYPEFSNLCSETIRNGNKMEQLALSRCRLAIYSSEWAASSALKNYSVDPAKVKVVPFGANINSCRGLSEIKKIIDNRNSDVCKLLFLGVDWHRKGGDTALAVAELLNKRGLKTELHIAGCNQPERLPRYAKHHGFVSKKNEEGLKYLERLFSESHFLILPSKAECCAVVFAEASSFGLPSLATNVGGIPTAIHNGKNGWLLPLEGTPEQYCEYIQSLMSSKDDYRELALSSYREFSERLNWRTAGMKVRNLLQEIPT
jgi:glycosyltransferase involved in cell wall biosynthesis